MEEFISTTTSTLQEQHHNDFSFDCTICFESFNTTDRPPVILPCGHTFLCAQCSQRLKSCMECRTSLFIKPRPKQQQSPPIASRRSQPNRRYGSRSAAATAEEKKMPHVVPEPIPLPLPKNLFMISMLEAANNSLKYKYASPHAHHRPLQGDELQHQEEHEAEEATSTSTSTSHDEQATDEEKVHAALESCLSPCGTYIVTDPNGLPVQKQMPRGYRRKWCPSLKTPDTHCYDEHERLHYGDRVQVVDIQDNYVKLARNRGYLIATASQLVRVSNAIDPACNLESLLCSTATKKKRVEGVLHNLHPLEQQLLEDLDDALEINYPTVMKPEIEVPSSNGKLYHSPLSSSSLNQIISPPFSPESTSHALLLKPSESITSIEMLQPGLPFLNVRQQQQQSSPGATRRVEFAQQYNPTKPPSTPNNKEDAYEVLGCTSFFGLNSTDPYYKCTTPTANATDDSDAASTPTRSTQLFYYPCPSQRFQPPNIAHTFSSCSTSPLPQAITHDTEHLRRRTFSANAVEPLRLHDIPPPPQHPSQRRQNNAIAIDFRTGMSGHLALTSARAHQLDAKRQPIRMMSDHKGISSIRRIRKQRPDYANVIKSVATTASGRVTNTNDSGSSPIGENQSASPKSPSNLSTKTW